MSNLCIFQVESAQYQGETGIESEEDIDRDTQGGRSVSGRGGSYKSHTSKYSTARGSDDSIARGSQGRSGLTGIGGSYTGYSSNSGSARGSNGQQVIKMFPIDSH